ncbi:hypothetical protein BGX26_011761 [Mortierella sp. AD094]|nr:hypothetical protein BGX26_011761 [Mortierella sp. AD094]
MSHQSGQSHQTWLSWPEQNLTSEDSTLKSSSTLGRASVDCNLSDFSDHGVTFSEKISPHNSSIAEDGTSVRQSHAPSHEYSVYLRSEAVKTEEYDDDDDDENIGLLPNSQQGLNNTGRGLGQILQVVNILALALIVLFCIAILNLYTESAWSKSSPCLTSAATSVRTGQSMQVEASQPSSVLASSDSISSHPISDSDSNGEIDSPRHSTLGAKHHDPPKLPPKAKRIPRPLTLYNETLIDNYRWMHQIQQDPDVVAYINTESKYSSSWIEQSGVAALQEQLEKETSQIRNAMDSQKSTYLDVDRWRYWLDESVGSYGVYMRRSISKDVYDQAAFERRQSYMPSQIFDYSNRHQTTFSPPSDQGASVSSSIKVVGGCSTESSPTSEIQRVLDINRIAKKHFIVRLSRTEYRTISESHARKWPSASAYETYLEIEDQAIEIAGAIVKDAGPETRFVRVGRSLYLYFTRLDGKGLSREVWRVKIESLDDEDPNSEDVCKQDEIETNKHELAKDNKPKYEPEMVLREKDERNVLTISETSDQRFLLIESAGQTNSHTYFFGIDYPNKGWSTVRQPEEDVMYKVEHHSGYFYLRTNHGNATNFKVIRFAVEYATEDANTPIAASSRLQPSSGPGVKQATFDDAKEEVVIANDPEEFLERLEVFVEHFVAWVWCGGLQEIRIILAPRPGDTSPKFPLVEVQRVRPYNGESKVATVMPGNIRHEEQILLKEEQKKEIAKFKEMRIMVPSKHSSKRNRAMQPNSIDQEILIPASVVYYAFPDRHQFPRHAAFVSAYGAYGSMTSPKYTPEEILPLLYCGLLFIEVHPRGDGVLGPDWYADGKAEHKMNTFYDVEDVLLYLRDSSMVEKEGCVIQGRSAGGLVSGWIANRWGEATTPLPGGKIGDHSENGSLNIVREMVKVVLAQVPFMDVIADMSDPDIPWVEYEWAEWGSPLQSREIFEVMKAYSPYDRIRNQPYPPMMIMGGLKDSRVSYAEPLKFVSKLRSIDGKTNDCQPVERQDDGDDERDSNKNRSKKMCAGKNETPLLLQIEEGGHFSGKKSLWMAFALHNLGTENVITQ